MLVVMFMDCADRDIKLPLESSTLTDRLTTEPLLTTLADADVALMLTGSTAKFVVLVSNTTVVFVLSVAVSETLPDEVLVTLKYATLEACVVPGVKGPASIGIVPFPGDAPGPLGSIVTPAVLVASCILSIVFVLPKVTLFPFGSTATTVMLAIPLGASLVTSERILSLDA